jgi:hypothetical protein
MREALMDWEGRWYGDPWKARVGAQATRLAGKESGAGRDSPGTVVGMSPVTGLQLGKAETERGREKTEP